MCRHASETPELGRSTGMNLAEDVARKNPRVFMARKEIARGGIMSTLNLPGCTVPMVGWETGAHERELQDCPISHWQGTGKQLDSGNDKLQAQDHEDPARKPRRVTTARTPTSYQKEPERRPPWPSAPRSKLHHFPSQASMPTLSPNAYGLPENKRFRGSLRPEHRGFCTLHTVPAKIRDRH